MSKVTQKQMAFYKLYDEFRKAKALPTAEERTKAFRYIATWEFGGEMFIPEIGEWVLMSYKCPTRLTDIFQENPGLIDREWITGKSGAQYFGYRFSKDAKPELIKDKKLLAFYQLIREKTV